MNSIVVHYQELALKGKNRPWFLARLVRNLREALSDLDVRSVRAVMHNGPAGISPLEALRKLEALSQMSGSESLLGVATLLKRVKNISKGVPAPAAVEGTLLTEPAERALVSALESGATGIRAAASRGDYRDAFTGIAALQAPVAKLQAPLPHSSCAPQPTQVFIGLHTGVSPSHALLSSAVHTTHRPLGASHTGVTSDT